MRRLPAISSGAGTEGSVTAVAAVVAPVPMLVRMVAVAGISGVRRRKMRPCSRNLKMILRVRVAVAGPPAVAVSPAVAGESDVLPAVAGGGCFAVAVGERSAVAVRGTAVAVVPPAVAGSGSGRDVVGRSYRAAAQCVGASGRCHIVIPRPPWSTRRGPCGPSQSFPIA
jgi:hypothetical protein